MIEIHTKSNVKATNAASSVFAGKTFLKAVTLLHEGVNEAFGRIGTDHIQLCPQQHGVLDERLCDELRNTFPTTAFRLHANVRVQHHFVKYDASQVNNETWHYFNRLNTISKHLGASMYSLHAGCEAFGCRESVRENVLRLRDLFGHDVALELLYPERNRNGRLLYGTWQDYEWWLNTGLPFALDLSHANILAHRYGRQDDLILAMLNAPQCREVHLSDNDGTHDRHLPLTDAPWWRELLDKSYAAKNDECVWFTEGNQMLFNRQHPN